MRHLDDEELRELLEEAAERGAEKAVERWTGRIYQEVGKSVLKKCTQMLGVLVVAGLLYALNKGWIN